MKRTITTLFRCAIILLFAMTLKVNAQITITQSDVLALKGVSQTLKSGNDGGYTINVGEAKATQQTWDFSSLSFTGILGTVSYIDPVGTPLENNFPDANLAIRRLKVTSSQTVQPITTCLPRMEN